MHFKKTRLGWIALAALLLWGGAAAAQDKEPGPADQPPRLRDQREGRRPAAREPSPYDAPPRAGDRERPGPRPPLGGPHRGPRLEPPHEGTPGPPHPPGGMPFGPEVRAELEKRRLEELQKYDPELYELETADRELERASFELGQQYRRAPREQQQELHAQLIVLVNKHFDARQARRQLHIQRLEEELKKLRGSIERRTELRDQIVERRVAELVGEEFDLDF